MFVPINCLHFFYKMYTHKRISVYLTLNIVFPLLTVVYSAFVFSLEKRRRNDLFEQQQ